MSVHHQGKQRQRRLRACIGISIESWRTCGCRGRGRAQNCESGGREMPSREKLRTITGRPFCRIVSGSFGLPDLTEEGVDYFVGHTLDATLRSLHQTGQRELQFAAQNEPGSGGREAAGA